MFQKVHKLDAPINTIKKYQSHANLIKSEKLQ